MPVRRLVVGPLGTNCYLVWEHDGPEALVVDPGGDADAIEREIRRLHLEPRVLFATHGHVDHIAATGPLKQRFPGMTFACMSAEREVLMRPTLNLSFFLGISIEPPEPDLLLEDGQSLAAGPMRFDVIHLPGHTRGGGALRGTIDSHAAVLAGDALFAGSIGRTDFPGGNMTELLGAIRSRLLVLGDDTVVYPGHGPETTIGRERRENPFLREA